MVVDVEYIQKGLKNRMIIVMDFLYGGSRGFRLWTPVIYFSLAVSTKASKTSILQPGRLGPKLQNCVTTSSSTF